MVRPRVTLLSFGSIKTPGLADALQHFEKLISRYGELTQRTLETAPVRGKGGLDVTRRLDTETLDLALRSLKPGTRAVVLDEHAPSWSSEAWAKALEQSNVAVCVGPPTGWHASLSKIVNHPHLVKIGLGSQTLSHEIAHLIAMEQIFRGLSILNHHPYHCV